MPKNSDWLNISELHEMTGIDRDTIRKRLKEVDFRLGAKNSKNYNRHTALPLLFGSGAAIEEDQAKKRKAAAEAEKVELQVKKLKGELVSVGEMKSAAAELIKTLYARTVRVEPGILASKCIGKNAIEIETIIRDGLAQVFNELKTMPENFIATVDEEEIEGGDEPDADQ